MKHIRKLIFTALAALFACSSCEMPNLFIKREKIEDYFVFKMSSEVDPCDCEEYFHLNDGETKVISSNEELDSFTHLIDDIENNFTIGEDREIYLNKGEMFSKEVDFTNKNVYVTAKYLGHGSADFTVISIYKKGTSVKQKIKVKVNIPAISSSDCAFIYVVADKGLDFTSKFDIDRDYKLGVSYKPVIYFYNDKELDFEVKYMEDYRLKTTYPKYEDGWRVHINENGTINVNDSQREYYAIFFDEYRTHEVSFEYGFNVSKDNAVSFLETSLDRLGFTEREADEFIMFWLPLLEENENSLVYFEQTNERNEECPLSFSVTPDTILRTIIHIKKVDSPKDIIPQELESITRTGFTVVEWGGTTY